MVPPKVKRTAVKTEKALLSGLVGVTRLMVLTVPLLLFDGGPATVVGQHVDPPRGPSFPCEA